MEAVNKKKRGRKRLNEQNRKRLHQFYLSEHQFAVVDSVIKLSANQGTPAGEVLYRYCKQVLQQSDI